jgi:hypothetical protein
MPTTYRILGQVIPGNTLTHLYVPNANPPTSSVVSSIVISNTGSADRLFSIFVASAPTLTGSVAFNTPVLAYDSVVLSAGLTLGPNNAIRVLASGSGTAFSDVIFTAFGTEIT